MRVKVYRNLGKLPEVVYSISDGRRVVDYANHVFIGDCEMKHATPAQCHRVRFGGANGTGCREVCQWLRGERLAKTDIPGGLDWRRLLCDPKDGVGFRDASTGELVDSAAFVLVDLDGKAYYANP